MPSGAEMLAAMLEKPSVPAKTTLPAKPSAPTGAEMLSAMLAKEAAPAKPSFPAKSSAPAVSAAGGGVGGVHGGGGAKSGADMLAAMLVKPSLPAKTTLPAKPPAATGAEMLAAMLAKQSGPAKPSLPAKPSAATGGDMLAAMLAKEAAPAKPSLPAKPSAPTGAEMLAAMLAKQSDTGKPSLPTKPSAPAVSATEREGVQMHSRGGAGEDAAERSPGAESESAGVSQGSLENQGSWCITYHAASDVTQAAGRIIVCRGVDCAGSGSAATLAEIEELCSEVGEHSGGVCVEIEEMCAGVGGHSGGVCVGTSACTNQCAWAPNVNVSLQGGAWDAQMRIDSPQLCAKVVNSVVQSLHEKLGADAPEEALAPSIPVDNLMQRRAAGMRLMACRAAGMRPPGKRRK
ncbi:hypothetical protein T484DRAFT_1812321 [Baffinella frigidus]|nr:hypothetical protein T484DRAFT_1812321 [Cryptophyta sp. CCMP2293]